MSFELSPNEIERYHKHLQLPDVGETGQLKLKAASVLIVGVGGLGSPAAFYLTAAGIGRIGLVDGDRVELSNLQRQILHSVQTLGQAKTTSGSDALLRLNPDIQVEGHALRLTGENADELFQHYDIIMDCTDNFSTRLLINRICVAQGKPMIHGAVYKYEGQVSVFHSPNGPCYQCLYPNQPAKGSIPDPAKTGLLSTTPGVIGVLMANEVLKIVLGIGHTLQGRLLLVDLLTMRFQEVKLKKNPKCLVCANA